MLRAIFKHFQLERGRLGTLGGRNSLKLSLAGPSLADLDAFREEVRLRADRNPRGRTTQGNNLV